MRRRIVSFLCLAITLGLSLTAWATDYSFTSPGNGSFYTSTDGGSWEPQFAESGYESASGTSGLAMPYDNDYVAPSTGMPSYPDVWSDDTLTSYGGFTIPDAVMVEDGSLGILTIENQPAGSNL